MKIYIGTDHAGFALREKLIPFLHELGHEVEDYGAHDLDPLDDYPDYVRLVALAVASDENARGFILGGTGQGEAMCANRVGGVRAAVYYGGPHEIITLSREHNDANVLSLGARFVNEVEAKEVARLWLATEFFGEERHVRRIEKLDKF